MTAVDRPTNGAAPPQLVGRLEAFFDNHPLPIGRRQADFPNRFDVVMRSFHLMQYNLAARGEHGSMLVEPEVGAFGWFEFERAREIMAEGYRAYRDVADTA